MEKALLPITGKRSKSCLQAICVVYFNQHLAATHSKCWSKYDIYQWIQSDLSHTYFLLLLSWTYSVLFLLNFVSIILLFSHFFQPFCTKNVKILISTSSVWSAQHPNAGRNIQHIWFFPTNTQSCSFAKIFFLLKPVYSFC